VSVNFCLMVYRKMMCGYLCDGVAHAIYDDDDDDDDDDSYDRPHLRPVITES
jgi:hypothetical protein